MAGFRIIDFPINETVNIVVSGSVSVVSGKIISCESGILTLSTTISCKHNFVLSQITNFWLERDLPQQIA